MDDLQLIDTNANQRPEPDVSNEDERMVLKVVVLSRENVDMPDGLCSILLAALNQSLDETGGTLLIRATHLEELTTNFAVVDLYEARHPTEPIMPTYMQLYVSVDQARDHQTIDTLDDDIAALVFFLSCLFIPIVVLIGIIFSVTYPRNEH